MGKLQLMRLVAFVFVLIISTHCIFAQGLNRYQRTTFNVFFGTSGANLQGLDDFLEDRGEATLPNSYRTYGLAYQSRFNDFIVGAELYQNNGANGMYGDYTLDYRTTRLFLNVGYSFTEEGRFHLIHYMSMGVGYLNFQMLKDVNDYTLDDFLENPANGFILRKNDITQGSNKLGGFLTEIGFEVGYDLNILPSEEEVSLIAKVGYSFNPFEESWKINGFTFDNLQSGAFIRIGAGITLPEENYFYRDASLGIHFIYGQHFSKPNALNQHLRENGYKELSGVPQNLGLKILGENRGFLYGLDVYNVTMHGNANENYLQSLNSVRVYGNMGQKIIDLNDWEVGLLGGLGYANLRYSLMHKRKVPFPELIDIPDYDGELRKGGMMAKPEVYLAYALSLSKKDKVDLVLSLNGGYELPIGQYKLGDVSMSKYMSSPYLQLGVGVRP